MTYDYSFWTIEDNGFRAGLGIGLNGFFPEFVFKEATTGFSTKFDTPVPAPEGRLAFEIPFLGDFLLDTEAGAFYLPPVGSNDFEGFLFQLSARTFWRPLEHIGGFVGFRWLHIDVEDDNNTNLDLNLWGPVVGVELRF